MTDVPSKHVWKIKESRIVFKDSEVSVLTDSGRERFSFYIVHATHVINFIVLLPNGYGCRCNGRWVFSNGSASRSNGCNFLANGYAAHSNGLMLTVRLTPLTFLRSVLTDD